MIFLLEVCNINIKYRVTTQETILFVHQRKFRTYISFVTFCDILVGLDTFCRRSVNLLTFHGVLVHFVTCYDIFMTFWWRSVTFYPYGFVILWNIFVTLFDSLWHLKNHKPIRHQLNHRDMAVLMLFWPKISYATPWKIWTEFLWFFMEKSGDNDIDDLKSWGICSWRCKKLISSTTFFLARVDPQKSTIAASSPFLQWVLFLCDTWCLVPLRVGIISALRGL